MIIVDRDSCSMNRSVLGGAATARWITLAALVAACTSVSPPAPSRVAMDSSFALRLGETAQVGDSGPKLTFLDVLEESRCPEDAVCVWAGNARIQLRVTTGSGSPLLELNTPQQPSVARHGDYEISLVSLTGPGKAGGPRSSIDYVATLRVAAK
ncbi:MAG: hypothetical protein ABR543_19475 [Gemmatimonadaceae bacterium]